MSAVFSARAIGIIGAYCRLEVTGYVASVATNSVAVVALLTGVHFAVAALVVVVVNTTVRQKQHRY
jgi:hypothetical protein